MSTFGSLQAAYTGLQAARAGMDLTGQNIANATTEGYTRQRVTQSAIGSSAAAGIFRTGVNIGQGTQVTGIERLGDSILDNRVRAASSTMGYWKVASSAMSTIETSLNEPGSNGLSVTMSKFWDAWQNVANNPGVPGQASTLLAQAGQTVSSIATGYTQASAGWADARSAAQTTVDTVNDAAVQVAQLNDQIRRTVASDGNANELLDQRSVLVTSLSGLTGVTVRDNGDSTIDLVLGGNSLVSGTTARKLALAGAARVEDASAAPVHVQWASSAASVDVEGGELAGRLATLAGPQPGGSGGPWAESAALYNRLATSLANTVNTVHSTGVTPSGGAGGNFFAVAAALPPALGLSVIPTDVSGIAAAAPGKGGSDGSIADAISRLATSPTGPDAAWSAYVVKTGVLSRTASQQAVLSTQATTVATTAQTSQSAVDIDEETTNLLMYQHAYQSAARMLTTVDEMLDTLINKTGLVGR